MAQETTTNKMGTVPVRRLMLTMGVPMILSMALQALYNIVDSFFVSSMPGTAEIPVSYTHLDVYKRQGIEKGGRKEWLQEKSW